MLRTVASRHDVEDDLGTNRLADPVALHDLDALGPVYSIKVVGQTIGVVGYPEEPLFQLLLLHRTSTAPALAILCLFIGQDSPATGTPPLLRLLLIGKAPFVQKQEEPLGPSVVFGIGGVDLPFPVIRGPDEFELPLEVGRVLNGNLARILLQPDSLVLGGEPECVPTHGVQDIEALHAVEAADDVGGNIVAAMADVQTVARGVGEVIQTEELWLDCVLFCPIGLRSLPEVLPFRFDAMEVVFSHRSLQL